MERIRGRIKMKVIRKVKTSKEDKGLMAVVRLGNEEEKKE